MRAIIIALAAATIALPAAAEEKPVELIKAPGLDKVEGKGCVLNSSHHLSGFDDVGE